MNRAEQMTEVNFLALFTQVGADLRGHFVLASRQHSDRYFNKKVVFEHAEAFRLVSEALAHRVMLDRPNVLVAPQSSGVKLAQAVQWALSENYGYSIPLIPAEKGPEETFYVSTLNQPLLRGKRVTLIEDVLTTGGSIKKVIELSRELGAEPISLHAFVNRGGITAEMLGVPKMTELARVNANSWGEADCPAWLMAVPVNETIGRGREYMRKKRSQA